jgi:ABC-type transport system involved in cytochrome c biogenesis permease component
MPTDWLFYYLTRPLGLLVIAVALAIPFGIWRAVLGSSFPFFGTKPVVFGYVAALTGLLLLEFISSYREFTSRVERGMLDEAARWSTIPGWTIYVAVLSLIVVRPLLGFVAVPITAALLKRRRFNYRSIGAMLLVAWLGLGLAIGSVPIAVSDGEQAHPLQILGQILIELLPGVLLIGLPFLGAIAMATGTKRHAAT